MHDSELVALSGLLDKAELGDPEWQVSWELELQNVQNKLESEKKWIKRGQKKKLDETANLKELESVMNIGLQAVQQIPASRNWTVITLNSELWSRRPTIFS